MRRTGDEHVDMPLRGVRADRAARECAAGSVGGGALPADWGQLGRRVLEEAWRRTADDVTRGAVATTARAAESASQPARRDGATRSIDLSARLSEGTA